MSQEKIKVFEEQIKHLQEKRAKLVQSKKEKDMKKKTAIAVKIFEVLESIGIDTEKKMEALRSLLQGNEDFKKMVVDFNIKVVGGVDTKEVLKHDSKKR